MGAQTRRVLENVKAILDAAGATLAHIVRTTIYLKNLDDFTQVNNVYAEYFPEHKPARSTVEVHRLPKDAVVAMDAIASEFWRECVYGMVGGDFVWPSGNWTRGRTPSRCCSFSS